MNKRIIELSQQAGLWASEQLPFTNPEWQELKEKKFAELIVAESIEVMVRHDYHGTWLGEKIKDHFGIKV